MAHELPIVELASQEAWERWLEAHPDADGAWLKIAKKDAGVTTVTYEEAVESALSFGWIDGQMRRFDERFYVQRFTPRRRASRWSKVNREKAEALIVAGRMRPAGLAQVEAAKADGRWEGAYDGARAIAVPGDLQRALDANPQAKAFFETLSGANRYAILYRIQDAKRPETRAKRIAQYVDMCARGETLH